MKTVTVVAKGPSAIHADRFIARCPGTHIACVNDSFELVTVSSHIEFCFFTHFCFTPKLIQHVDRFGMLVCPDLKLYEKQEPPIELMPKLRQYRSRNCAGSAADIIAKIASGQIAHHNTVNGALHWLAKHGKYQKIRLIGVDGGRCYAKGMKAASPDVHQSIVKAEGTEDYFDIWKEVTVTLCGVLRRIYGVEIERYGD